MTSKIVLYHTGESPATDKEPGVVMFEKEYDTNPVLGIDTSDWEAMGKPEIITLTIELGDTLAQ